MGGVWDYRLLGGHDYEIRRDRRPMVLVSIHGDTPAPSLLMRELVATTARHAGGTVAADAAPFGPDWSTLGWSSRAEHDEALAALQRTRAAWSESPLCARLDAYVAAERAGAGIALGAPYSKTDLDTLARIVRRAPEVVSQDYAAERGAA